MSEIIRIIIPKTRCGDLLSHECPVASVGGVTVTGHCYTERRRGQLHSCDCGLLQYDERDAVESSLTPDDKRSVVRFLKTFGDFIL